MKKDILSEVAKAHGVSREEVEREIRLALMTAMGSKNPVAKAFWDKENFNPATDPVEKAISGIAKEVSTGKKAKKI